MRVCPQRAQARPAYGRPHTRLQLPITDYLCSCPVSLLLLV